MAEDLGCRDVEWWRSNPYEWFFANVGRIPVNLGVDDKWKAAAVAGQ